MPISVFNKIVKEGFEKTVKKEDGSLERKDGIKILQDIFKSASGMFAIRSREASKETVSGPYSYNTKHG